MDFFTEGPHRFFSVRIYMTILQGTGDSQTDSASELFLFSERLLASHWLLVVCASL